MRSCVECTNCFTLYLIGFSPYRNGSCLVRIGTALCEEYVLYCSCGNPPVRSWWRQEQVKTYAVSKAAHTRGYGSHEEIVQPTGSRFGNWRKHDVTASA
jgi:hypothetical protein